MRGEWRCTGCDRLLGVFDGQRLHVRLGRSYEYLVGLPVTSVCRSCKRLNEIREAPDAEREALTTPA